MHSLALALFSLSLLSLSAPWKVSQYIRMQPDVNKRAVRVQHATTLTEFSAQTGFLSGVQIRQSEQVQNKCEYAIFTHWIAAVSMLSVEARAGGVRSSDLYFEQLSTHTER